jgi:hypothetical protein
LLKPWIDAQSEADKKQTSLIICFRKMKSVQEATLTNKTKQKSIRKFPGLMVMKKMNTAQGIFTGLRHLAKLNADDATRLK